MPFSPPEIGAVNFTTTGQVYIPPGGSEANFVLQIDSPVGDGALIMEFFPAGLGEVLDVSVQGAGDVAVDFITSGYGAHGEAGIGDFCLSFAPVAAGMVARYELRGEVRKDGVLINRLVRAYRRDTGALVGEDQTFGGKFRVSAEFEAREYYVVPIDMANDATDWLPPTANRIISELAQDAV